MCLGILAAVVVLLVVKKHYIFMSKVYACMNISDDKMRAKLTENKLCISNPQTMLWFSN